MDFVHSRQKAAVTSAQPASHVHARQSIVPSVPHSRSFGDGPVAPLLVLFAILCLCTSWGWRLVDHPVDCPVAGGCCRSRFWAASRRGSSRSLLIERSAPSPPDHAPPARSSPSWASQRFWRGQAEASIADRPPGGCPDEPRDATGDHARSASRPGRRPGASPPGGTRPAAGRPGLQGTGERPPCTRPGELPPRTASAPPLPRRSRSSVSWAPGRTSCWLVRPAAARPSWSRPSFATS